MSRPESIELPIYSERAHFEVDRALGEVQFACDLDVCKGACCTMPADAGAPILHGEIEEIERVLPAVRKYLPPEALEIIDRTGVYEKQSDGTLTIPAIRGRDCVFVMYDNNSEIAYCAIERAYRAGEITGFPKPISCHLFPIRIYPTGESTFEIVYEEISECKGGRARGKRERIPVLDFLDTPLARALGAERLDRLRKALIPENG
ncbi:MAG: DUF3109 family protein [Bacteroidota bacterium]|nr:DUF3109 family protein [Bacteroidota bacterium]MDP4234279.1 DUF3109 family protein [Bacteroidota bacterium]MDP4243214.1 DUF3109 family protein [Bacteroidota bacterium]MDP4288080.1 DUF3109 family protein [Bacteroidota bacterium]